MVALAASLPFYPSRLQACRKQIMENNRYKWLMHQTTWWMQPRFPASHPFLFSFPCSLLSLLSPLSLDYMSLFGNRGGLEHSRTKLPYHCKAASSVFPSWHWHYIHTDIILGKVLFFLSPHYYLFLFPLLLSPLALTSPLIPQSILHTTAAKQTPGTF